MGEKIRIKKVIENVVLYLLFCEPEKKRKQKKTIKANFIFFQLNLEFYFFPAELRSNGWTGALCFSG